MANQYHDETGKFCSRDEMGAAIDRVAGSGDFEKALEMERERSTFDREEAAKVTAFYKATTETLSSSYGFRANQGRFSSMSSPIRDFAAPLTAATTPEQIREIIQLAGEHNFGYENNLDAAWANPAADASVRAELLRYAKSNLVGTASAQHGLEKLTPADADAIDEHLDESDDTDKYVRVNVLMPYLSEKRAVQLVRADPQTYTPAHARRRPYDSTLRDNFIDYAKPDVAHEYNVFADEVAEKVAQYDRGELAFRFALRHGEQARLAAAKNAAIDVNRAQDLVTAQSIDGFPQLKQALLDNKQTPLVVKQALAAQPVPLGDEAGEARLAQIAAWKEEGARLERERDWIGSGRAYRKARRALAKTDAAPVAFAQLSKRWANSQANYAKGTGGKPSKAYLANKERYENAVAYQQTHAAKSAVERLARTPGFAAR